MTGDQGAIKYSRNPTESGTLLKPPTSWPMVVHRMDIMAHRFAIFKMKGMS